MALQMYRKMTGQHTTTALVTLTSSVISFNVAAIETWFVPMIKKLKFKVKCIPYVELGYDPDTKEIWMFPTETEGLRSLCVQQKKHETARVATSGFAKRFGLQDACYKVLNVRLDEKAIVLAVTNELVTRRQYKPKTTPPVSTPRADPELVPCNGNPRRDFQCEGCGYGHVNWKYQKAFRGTWHPIKCPKCGCTSFVPEE